MTLSGYVVDPWRRDRPIDSEDFLHPVREPTMAEDKEYLLKYFKFEHLKPELQPVSRRFCEFANEIVASLPRNPERTVALRKLLEAKDCAVRAALPDE